MPISPDITTACTAKGCHCGRYSWGSLHDGGTCFCGHTEKHHPVIVTGVRLPRRR